MSYVQLQLRILAKMLLPRYARQLLLTSSQVTQHLVGVGDEADEILSDAMPLR
jgi:hypothetical protein